MELLTPTRRKLLLGAIGSLFLIGSAWGSILLTGVGGPVASGPSPATFTKTATITAGAGVYPVPAVYTGVTFNTGSSDLAVVELVADLNASPGSVTAITVGSCNLTLVSGTENTSEQYAVVAYGACGALTTATVTIATTAVSFDGLIAIAGKVTTTTPTPYSTDASTSSQGGGVSTPFPFYPRTGSGGVPANGVGVGAIGNFLGAPSTFSAVAPNSDYTSFFSGSNNTAAAFGHTTVSGATSGVTVTSTASSIFPGWAIVSWSP